MTLGLKIFLLVILLYILPQEKKEVWSRDARLHRVLLRAEIEDAIATIEAGLNEELVSIVKLFY